MIVLSGNIGPASGGVERTLGAFARELGRRGRDVACLEVHPGTCAAGIRPLPARVAWARGPAVVLNPLRLRRALTAALRSVGSEVEQVWTRNATVAAVASRVLPGCPVVFIPPGTAREILPYDRFWRGSGPLGLVRKVVWGLYFEPLERRAERRALDGAHAVVVFSENMAGLLEASYGAGVRERLHVVPPGVDAGRFRPLAGGETVPDLPVPEPRVAYLGRLESRKGPDLLLGALRRLPGVSLVFMGDGAMRSDLERRSLEWGLERRVAFLGHVAEPEHCLRGCRVLALPSRVEPFGHVMLEALASGLPVVGFARAAGASTAVEDVVRPRESGILVAEMTPAALADGIEAGLALAAEPGTGARCREYVLRRHDWGVFVDRVLEIAGR